MINTQFNKTNNPDKMFLNGASFTSQNSIKTYKKNEIIIKPQDLINCVYYLKSGFVRAYSVSSEGKELTFNIYKPGTYFLLNLAMSKTTNNYYFECLTDAVVLKVSKDQVANYISNNPAFFYTLTQEIINELDDTKNMMEIIASKNATNQICSILCILTKKFGTKLNDNSIVIPIPLTHRIIGTLTGLSREATSRELEKLLKQKVIDYVNHMIIIKNLPKLNDDYAFGEYNHVYLTKSEH